MATTRERNGQAPGSQAKKRPVFSRKYFPVEVAVFEHHNDDRTNYTVSVTRTFRRDEESPWESTPYLTVADLLPAATLLEEAYRFIQSRLQHAYQESRDGDAPAEKLPADFNF